MDVKQKYSGLFRGKTLKTKILVPFIFLILFAGGIVAIISYNFTIKMMVNELTKSAESQMSNMSDTFDMFFANTDTILNQYTSSQLVLNYKSKNRDELLERMQETKDANSAMTFIYAVDEKTGDMIDPTADLDEDYNPKERPWYKEAVAASGETIWTSPYIDEGTGEIVLTAARAYYKKNELKGVFAVDVTINTLMDMVQTMEIGETGYAVVLDEAGNYIAHSDKGKIGKAANDELFGKLNRLGKKGSVEYQLNDEEKIMSFVKNTTTNWLIGGTVDKAEFAKKAQSIIWPIVIALVIVIGIGIIFSLFITSRITKPIQLVMQRMNKIADGDLSNPPLSTDLQDETGQLIIASNKMSENMQDLLSRIQTASETVSSQSEELTQFANEVNSGTEQVATTVQELAAGSENQAHSTNDLANGMSHFMTKIKDAYEKGIAVEANSKIVQDLTKDGSKRMQESTAQMDTIYSIVHDAVEKVAGLDEHAKRISELIAMIHRISDQTNLLALNATIEAARAGEHGKGFAVVADEIRKLAEEVDMSLTDITEIVTSIQSESVKVTDSLQTGYHEVEEGTSHIQTTLQTFGHIKEAISEMANHIIVMSSHLHDITEAGQAMNRSIEEVASISQEAAAGVEEVSATTEQTSTSMEEVVHSSERLEQLADDLHQLITKFKF